MKNLVQNGKTLSLACTSPVAVTAGSPVRFGNLTGVAITAEGDGGNISTEATVRLEGGVYSLSVTDTVGGGIAAGDSLFFADGAPPTITNNSAGYFFGFALEAVGVGATATINVLHVQSPGAGTLGAGTVGAANLAAGAAKTNLTTTPATTAELDPTLVQYAIVAVTNAQIKGLRAAPKELVAAPGAGKLLEFISATLLLDYGANVLTRPNGDEDMVVKFENAAGPVASEVTAAGFPVAAADQVCFLGKAATATMTAAGTVNKALVLHNDGTGEFGGNAGADTVLRVKVAYRLHTTAF